MKKLKLPRGICKNCGKETALRRPSGDWLGALYPRRHYDAKGQICEGCIMEIEISREPLHED